MMEAIRLEDGSVMLILTNDEAKMLAARDGCLNTHQIEKEMRNTYRQEEWNHETWSNKDLGSTCMALFRALKYLSDGTKKKMQHNKGEAWGNEFE